MIDKKSLKKLLEILKYSTENGILYEKQYSEFGCSIYVDFSSQKIVYPEDKGFVVNDKTTCNFDHPENFVVFECIQLNDKDVDQVDNGEVGIVTDIELEKGYEIFVKVE